MLRRARHQTDWFSEMELCVSENDLMTSRCSVHDFYSFVQNHVVVWMNSQVFITTTMTHQSDTNTNPLMHHMLTIGSRSSFSVFASNYDSAIAACDFLLCFFAKSKVPNVSLHCCNTNITTTLPVSAQALSHFMGQATLSKLELYHVDLDETFGHALSLRGSSSSSNFELALERCGVHCHAGGGEQILIHGLQSIRGALEVKKCWIDSRIIAATLSGDNCHLKKLKLTTAPNHYDNSMMDQIAQSVQTNNTGGLVELAFGCMPISDQDLAVLCHSLTSHTTATTLDLSQAREPGTSSTMRSQESKTFWLQTIVQMLKANTVLDTIKLPKHFMTAAATADIYCYQEEIVARLEMNRFRIRLDAIKNIPDTALRAKLLGRELALPSVRYRPNQTFMLISENVELVASYSSYCCSRKRKRHRADVYD
jgi:hypothetical protein